MKTIELFKEFVKTSNVFIEFEEKRQDARNQIELKKIDIVMNNFDKAVKRLQIIRLKRIRTSTSVSLNDEKTRTVKGKEIKPKNCIKTIQTSTGKFRKTLLSSTIDLQEPPFI